MKIRLFDKEIFSNEEDSIELFRDSLPTIDGEPTESQLDNFIKNKKVLKLLIYRKQFIGRKKLKRK